MPDMIVPTPRPGRGQAAPTSGSGLLPADGAQDEGLCWLEAIIDARLHTARKRERLQRVAGALLATLAAVGVGVGIGGVL